MSLLVVGLSHRTAPVSVLERASIGRDELGKTVRELIDGEHIAEALVLSTCNRVEVYAEVEKFHGGVNDVTALLARRVGVSVADLSPYLYLHYEDAAVAHTFSVAAGLDSMVIGEAQVLGQLRTAYAVATEEGAAGRVIHELAQQALRVGKRAHSETGIDGAGRTLVSVALDESTRVLGELGGRRALVVGAGAMGALAGATLQRRGVEDIVLANRTPANAERLGAGLSARVVGLDSVARELGEADLLIASTGATGLVVDADMVQSAVAARAGRPLVVLDLALPRDVDPIVEQFPTVTYIDLAKLQEILRGSPAETDVDEARRIVEAEVEAFLSWQRSVKVAPTVAALRAQAADVVSAELLRLDSRVPELESGVRAEIAQTVGRVVDKLLHAPTVRVKQLAGEPGGETYAAALRELFGLDPDLSTDNLAAAVTVPVEAPPAVSVEPSNAGGAR